MGAVFFTPLYRTHGEARTAQEEEESVIFPPQDGLFMRFKMSDAEHKIVKITMHDGTLLYCRESELRRAIDCLK